MSRRRKDPLRLLTDDERRELTQVSHSRTAPAVRVARAVVLLAVADGSDYQQAARAAGRKSGDAVSHLVARFNREGLTVLAPRHGGGHEPTYDTAARDRILREVARTPTPETDGTATWSLTILRRVLRGPPTGSRRSRRSPSGRCSAVPGTRSSARVLGARAERPRVAARPVW